VKKNRRKNASVIDSHNLAFQKLAVMIS